MIKTRVEEVSRTSPAETGSASAAEGNALRESVWDEMTTAS